MKQRRGKRQRWAVWILCIFMLVSMSHVPAQAEEESWFYWEDPSQAYWEQGSDFCPESGNGEHEWVLSQQGYYPPSCETEGRAGYDCKYCGAWKWESIPATGHSFTEWRTLPVRTNAGEVIPQPDCTQAFSQYRECTVCGKTEYRTTQPGEHSFGAWVTTRQATCTQEGQEMRTCSVCGATEQRSTGLGDHSYGAWVTTQYATCTTPGKETRTCSLCGRSEERSTGFGAHQFGAWTEMRAATCEQKGILYRECAYCKGREYQYTDKVGHSFGAWAIVAEATDFATGTMQRVCSVCGLTEQVYYDPEGTLRYGDNGPSVAFFQQLLNAAGFNCGEADGDYGEKTKKAVVEFEQAHGLRADGVGWPGIQKMLSGEDEPVDPPAQRPVETPIEQPVETPIKQPVETPIEQPVETPIEQPVETPVEQPETRPDGSQGDNNGSTDPEPPDGNDSSQTAAQTSSLDCFLKVNKAYAPRNGKYYYAGNPVVINVYIRNSTTDYIWHIYCYEDETGDQITYDPHIYPEDWQEESWYKKYLADGYTHTFQYYHVITPEEALAGKYEFSVYATASDASEKGNKLISNVATIELPTSGTYNPPSYLSDEPAPTDLTLDFHESSQAGHVRDRYYYYEYKDTVRYKITLRNDTDKIYTDIDIGQGVEVMPLFHLDELNPGEEWTDYYYQEVASISVGVEDSMYREIWVNYRDEEGNPGGLDPVGITVPTGLFE